jgi:hypothetical protein
MTRGKYIMKRFLILCIVMHTGIFASTSSERMALLKNKAAQRQANIDSLQQSITDAERQLTKARSEESRLKDNLADIIESTDASVDSMHDQLQQTLNITLEQTEEHTRKNIEKQDYIERFDTIRLRYEDLFKILMDKLKALQRSALQDAETIARLKLERDMYLEKPASIIAISKPKLSTSSASAVTQTTTPARRTSPQTASYITSLPETQKGMSSDGWMNHWNVNPSSLTTPLTESAKVRRCQEGVLAIQGWKDKTTPDEESITAMIRYLNNNVRSVLKIQGLGKRTDTHNVKAVCKTQAEAHQG